MIKFLKDYYNEIIRWYYNEAIVPYIKMARDYFREV